MASRVYVSVRVFKHDPEGDTPYVRPNGATISEAVIAFENLANASAVYEDCYKPLQRAVERGVHNRTDRVRPGSRASGAAEPADPPAPTADQLDGRRAPAGTFAPIDEESS